MGAKYEDVRDIIRYIYIGSITVEERRLQDLQSAAHTLGITVQFPELNFCRVPKNINQVEASKPQQQPTAVKIFNLIEMQKAKILPIQPLGSNDQLKATMSKPTQNSSSSSNGTVGQLLGFKKQPELKISQSNNALKPSFFGELQLVKIPDNVLKYKIVNTPTTSMGNVSINSVKYQVLPKNQQQTTTEASNKKIQKTETEKSTNLDQLIEEIRLRKSQEKCVPKQSETKPEVDSKLEYRKVNTRFLRPLRKLSYKKYIDSEFYTKAPMKKSKICRYCKIEYINIDRHRLNCHLNPRRTRFTCPICTQSFTRKENVTRHIINFHRDVVTPVMNSSVQIYPAPPKNSQKQHVVPMPTQQN